MPRKGESITKKLFGILGIILFAALGAPARAYACTADQIDYGTGCANSVFSVGTTSIAANGTFLFYISAKGTFYVDCGVDGTLSGSGVTAGSNIIDRATSTTNNLYTCTYSSAGTKTIRFGGVAEGYNTGTTTAAISFYKSSGGTQAKVASVSGSLSDIFPYLGSASGQQPRFYRTFRGCTQLASVPDTLVSSYTTAVTYLFSQMFYGCSKLEGSISPNMFAGLIANGSKYTTSMMASIFYGTTKLAESCTDPDTTQYFTGYEDYFGGKVSCISTTPFAVTLDTTDADSPAVPATIYRSYNTAWYSDSAGTNAITALTTLPTKTGKTFGGFYTGPNATGTKVIDRFGNFVNNTFPHTFTTLYAHFGDQYTVTYSCGDATGTPPASDIGISGAPFTIASPTNCVKDGYEFMGWYISGTTGVSASNTTFTWDYTENKTITAQWIDPKVTVTTTNIAKSGTVKFYISASGTFAVDCGANGVLSGTGVSGKMIDRTSSTTNNLYTCTYSVAGNKTLRFGGLATGYNTSATTAAISFYKSSSGTQTKIASVTGDLSDIFPYISGNAATGAQPRFYQTFRGCSALTSISDTLFSGYTTGASNMFDSTFYGCTGLTSIPDDLFSGYTTGASYMFDSTFYGCTGLMAIPDDLFSGITTGASYMFQDTFRGCTGLTSIPDDLFSGITTGANYMFASTFYGCTGLTSIPAGLFSNITTSADYMFSNTFNGCTGLTSIPAGLFSNISTSANSMFSNTFSGCTNLAGYIPPSTFAGLVSAGAPTATSMWNSTFNNTALVASCPTGTTQYITGYEGNVAGTTWNGRVSCISHTPIEITLDDTGTTSGAVPSTLYVSYGDGWYADSAGNTAITTLTTLPTKTGMSFGGFYTGPNATGTLVIDQNGNLVNSTFTYKSITLYPYFDNGYTVTYSCGDGTGTPPANDTAVSGSNFVTASPTGCTRAGYEFAGWAVSGTNGFVGTQFTWNYTENKTLTAQWFESKFSVTTINMPAGSTFRFSLSALGTFYINWGDGTGETIKRTNSTVTDYTHTYATGGIKTIKFGGLATSYNSNGTDPVAAISFKNSIYVASVAGDLSVVFPYNAQYPQSSIQPRFRETFMNCTNLTSVTNTLFNGYTAVSTHMFRSTFNGCTGLTSIPAGLFSNITTGATYAFAYTFQNCTELTGIPDDLFGGIITGADYMFYYTFNGCTGLTSIPDDLFSGITTGASYMFSYTFNGCTGLTSIPDGLFSGITTGANYMFQFTFNGCTGLTSIPDDLFSGITTGADYMFSNTFNGCTGLTSIPDDLFSGITTGASYMFSSTFNGCTGLIAIPGNLFSGITTSANAMFSGTFAGCTNLAGYIPPSTFAGLIANDHPTASYMWSNTFNNTALVASCPTGTTQYITGYEGDVAYTTWNGKVSCRANEPMEITLDTTGATSGVVPSTIYVMYNGGWSSDAAGNNSISALTTLPTKTGEVFQGFYTGPNGTGTLVINKNGTLIDTTESNNALVMSAVSKLYAHFANEYTVTYSCGAGTGTPPANDTVIGGLMFTPAASTCTRANHIFMGWNVSGTNDTVSNSFRWNYNSNKTLTANWLAMPFNITTTSLAANTEFSFTTSAIGTFYIDWGDGTPLEIISKPSTSSQTYTHTYTTGGVKTIQYGGTATNYNPDWDTATINFSNSCDYIGAIDGNLSTIFPYISGNAADGAQPRFRQTFDGCSHLTAIPDTLFTGYTTASSYMFALTFVDCTGLTEIPEDLFANITTTSDSTFMGTFAGCTGLTEIPEDLFSSITTTSRGSFAWTFLGCSGLTEIPSGLFHSITTGTSQLFSSTFASCTGLTEIPEDLFSTITNTTNATYMFSGTFQNCTGLTEIPEDLFGNITTSADYMFHSTFNGCTGLTAIPEDLFGNITTSANSMFSSTFNGCTGLTSIPAGLFSNITTGADSMFLSTFNGCTGLTSIPAGLFSNISTSADYMFSNTFNGCTGVTALPENLFSGVTTAATYMFSGTFDGCTNLAGYIPPSTFAGLIANGHPSTSYMWNNTFRGTQLVSSCPTGTTQYTTGYENSNWGGKKSCELKSYTCTAGNYVPANNDGCTACVGAAYCPGGTYTFSTTESQGITACPTGYTYNTASGKTSISQCQIQCAGGTYVDDSYTELEYIESTGTQYIDTGIKLASTDIIEARFRNTSSNQGSALYGVYAMGESSAFYANSTYYSYGVSNNKVDTNIAIDTQWHNLVHDFVTGYLQLDTNRVNFAPFTFTNSVNNYLFSRFYNNAYGYNFIGEIKSYKITRNAQVIMDLIPVRRNSDNAIGMYDRVTNTFFGNAGTGTFIAGTDVGTIGAQCKDVGVGHYSSSSVVNYGSTSTRTACAAGTYSDITNAATCSPCAGATYSDIAGATSCTACPTGYTYNTTSGKTSASQCQIHCDAGTYVSGYTELEYIHFDGADSTGAYIDTGIYVPTDVINSDLRYYADARVYQNDKGGTARYDMIMGMGYTWMGILDGKIRYGAGPSFSATGVPASYNRCIYDLNIPAGTYTVYDTVTDSYAENIGSINKGVRDFSSYINIGTWNTTDGTPNTMRATMDLYRAKIYNNGTLIFDGIPMLRNSDGEIGLYDLVTNTFKTKPQGANELTPGPVVRACTDVGTGYYSSASTVNWGGTSTRTACAAGTYSDITNAATCSPCAGATYSDTTGASACTACPTGYTYNTTSGKTSASQCQIHCDAGTYVSGYTELEYIEGTGTQYINTGVSAPNGFITDANVEFTNMAKANTIIGEEDNTNAANPRRNFIKVQSNKWLLGMYTYVWGSTATANTRYHVVGSTVKNGGYIDVNDTRSASMTTNNELSDAPLLLFATSWEIGSNSNNAAHMKMYDIKIYDNNNILVRDMIPVRRYSDNAVGMYDRVTNTFYGNAGTGTFTAGSDVVAFGNGGQCTDVGAGYYSSASTVNWGGASTRSACAAGMTTVGYGHGADSVNDCGHVLHLGSQIVYMRQDKQTNPSLNVKFENGDTFYISLSPSDHTLSDVHLGTGDGVQYTIYDDSLAYGERDYATGQKITS